MARPTNIWAEIIARNRAELESFGLLHCRAANAGKPGRPSKAFYLNEEQALLVIMFFRTPKAAQARREIIAVFQAYRRGELAQAPQPKLLQAYLEALESRIAAEQARRAHLRGTARTHWRSWLNGIV